MGEIMFRGNIMMKGYLKNPAATAGSVRGRLVPHRRPRGARARRLRQDQGPQQGHHHLGRREHFSSIEVEDVLYRHPAVLAAAVVAKPDPRWGETPLRIRRAEAGRDASTAAELSRTARALSPASRCRARWASASCRRLDRQDPEVRAAQAGGLGRGHRRLKERRMIETAGPLVAIAPDRVRRAGRGAHHAEPAATRSTRCRKRLLDALQRSLDDVARDEMRASSCSRARARRFAQATT